jgi:hypothetical protein
LLKLPFRGSFIFQLFFERPLPGGLFHINSTIVFLCLIMMAVAAAIILKSSVAEERFYSSGEKAD